MNTEENYQDVVNHLNLIGGDKKQKFVRVAVHNYVNDIDAKLAESAFYGTSHCPARRGEQYRKEYAAYLEAFRTHLETYMTGDHAEKIDEEFSTFRERFVRKFKEFLGARSRVMSPMITGPANFPAYSNRKRMAASEKKERELSELLENAKKSILRRYYKDPKAPIKSSDTDAVERLEAKIAKLKKYQETMKAANAVIRKAKGDKEKAIAGLIEIGLSEQTAKELLTPDCGLIGYQSFSLTNNLAEIKRLEGRLRKINQAQKIAPKITETETGIRIEKLVAINRIRIYFPEKPEPETRQELKSYGFRWAPSIGAWQGYVNDRTTRYIKQFAA